jgi:hypothetical protein
LQILEILVVALDQDLVISALEMLSPFCHCLDNHQEPHMVHVVVLFGGRAFSGVEIDWAKNPRLVVLFEDAGECEAACIGV